MDAKLQQLSKEKEHMAFTPWLRDTNRHSCIISMSNRCRVITVLLNTVCMEMPLNEQCCIFPTWATATYNHAQSLLVLQSDVGGVPGLWPWRHRL